MSWTFINERTGSIHAFFFISGRVQSEGQSATATVRQYLKSMSRKSSLEKVVEKSRNNYGLGLSNSDNNLTKPSDPPTSLATTSEKATPKEPQFSNSVNPEYELKLKM